MFNSFAHFNWLQFILGTKKHPGRSNHKQKVLNTSVNYVQDTFVMHFTDLVWTERQQQNTGRDGHVCLTFLA